MRPTVPFKKKRKNRLSPWKTQHWTRSARDVIHQRRLSLPPQTPRRTPVSRGRSQRRLQQPDTDTDTAAAQEAASLFAMRCNTRAASGKIDTIPSPPGLSPASSPALPGDKIFKKHCFAGAFFLNIAALVGPGGDSDGSIKHASEGGLSRKDVAAR